MIEGTAERRTGERRARRVSFHYPERRTGFDRRDGSRFRQMLEGYRRRPALVAGCLGVVVVLQVLDLVLTARLLRAGATELNPIMAGLFEAGIPAAAALKAAVTALVVAGVWRFRRYRRILEFSLALAAGSALVVAYQAAGALAAV